jgi:hypothetical protein
MGPVLFVLLVGVAVIVILLVWRSAIEHRYLFWRAWAKRDANLNMETYGAELEVQESYDKHEKDPAP